LINPVLRDCTQRISAGGSANLVAHIIATRHWPVGNVAKPICNSSAITLADTA
jgi:hypothetical protein